MFTIDSCQHDFAHMQGLEICRPKGTAFFLFVLFKSPAEVLFDGQWVPAQGHYVLYAPFYPQHYRSIGQEPYRNDYIHFYCDNGNFFHSINLPMNRPFPCTDEKWVDHCMQNLHNLRFAPSLWQGEIADAELSSLFLHLSAQLNSSEPHRGSRQYPVFAAIRNDLYSCPSASVRICDLAERAGMSASHFQSVYKSLFDVSVGTDIIQSRLERARYLLSSSDYSVEEIGDMSGYACTSHFIRQFKKFTATTPGKYRHARRGQPD